MIKLIYKVEAKDKDFELQWLNDQRIYPAVKDWWDWTKNSKHYIQFGMIVNEQQALAVKLRHPLQFQTEYKQ
jgi:hypothetical protein